MLIRVGSSVGVAPAGGGAIASRSPTPSTIATFGRSVDIVGSGVPETSQDGWVGGYRVRDQGSAMVDRPPPPVYQSNFSISFIYSYSINNKVW